MLLAGLVLALAVDQPGAALTPWVPGTLDIHQIATGRGNSAFLQLPDGSTLLIDAGAAGELKYADPKPDASMRPGQWIAAYIDRVLPKEAPRRIDAALVTHLHVDHIGGLADVNAVLPVRRLIDRGSPDYDYPEPVPDALMKIHRPVLDAIRAQGGTIEKARAGSKDQIALANPGSVKTPFEIRVVAANGEVWTGESDGTRSQFPPQSATTKAEDRPSENECSIAVRLTFGAFTFYTGGDLTGIPDPGQASWRDLETPIGRAIGATDVRVMNHHGSISPDNAAFLAATHSRVVIIPAWSPTHPAPDALKRALAPTAYPGPRDVFIINLREPTAITIGDRVRQLKSAHGHVVVRVDPSGKTYRVVVVDDESADPKVLSVFGPYDAMRGRP
jgi:beta-lactamase superfamily II metal-dependent hydrolase